MIGKLTFDKSSKNISYFLYSIIIVYENGGRIKRDEFTSKMAAFLDTEPTYPDGMEKRTPYNKSKLPKYFGFLNSSYNENKQEILVLTKRGKRVIDLIQEDIDAPAEIKYSIKLESRPDFANLILESVFFDTFGKNNGGVEQSNSDVEPPKILFKMLADLDECTAEEFCYVIYGLNNLTFTNYDQAVECIKSNRSLGVNDYMATLKQWSVGNFAEDCKLANFMADPNVGLVDTSRNTENDKQYYRLSVFWNDELIAKIHTLSGVNQPLRMFAHFTKPKPFGTKWVNNVILGRMGNANNIFMADTQNADCFLGFKQDDQYFPKVFDKIIFKCLSNLKENYYLVIDSDSESSILELFGKFTSLLHYEIDLADDLSGWSKTPIVDDDLAGYIRECASSLNSSARSSVIKYVQNNEIRIPSNLQIIGVVNMSELDDETMVDYHFKRAVVDSDQATTINNPNAAPGGCNKIFYGAPGCGKSYYIEHEILDRSHVAPEDRFRTTFHPDYSNSDFVGQILPKINDEGDVTYEFTPGPFALALKRSCQTDKMVYLVIEEINRGNASAIFGDIFQLLDRVNDFEKDNYGESEYGITNVNLQDYLKKELGREYTHIKIPSNLTILATMNSSDQNVFTMDTAFKRRWNFEQISNVIREDENHPYKDWFIPGTKVTWTDFLKTVNDKILEMKVNNSTNEDKRLGKYFVTKNCLTDTVKDISECRTEAKSFAYKVLEYLWNDVCKFDSAQMFNNAGEIRTLEELIDAFNTQQLEIFNMEFPES